MEDINDVIGSVQRMKKMLFEEAARRREAKMESLVGDKGDELVTLLLTREQVFYLLDELKASRGAKKEAEAQGVAVDELLDHSSLQDEQKRMVRAVYAVLDALFTATGWTEEDL
jgi:hypothetical protein|nr:MAG TPA: hypothetical protein [Caudoviricetes sp.]